MSPTQVASLVKSTWQESLPEHRLAAIKRVRGLLAADDYELFDANVDMLLTGIQGTVEDSTTVVLIHGIRTDGKWAQLVRKHLLGVPGVTVIPAGYGYFGAIGLFGPFRKGPAERVKRTLRQIRRDEPSTKLVVIAHSFGTHIISNVLRTEPDIQLTRLLLCGSIVKTSFRWDNLPFDKLEPPIVNDVGTRDFYPVLATGTTLGYGPSGRIGFQTAQIHDRYFNYGHSDFFSDEHISRYWLPFVKDGEVVESEWEAIRPSTSAWILAPTWFQGSFIVALIVALAMIYGAIAVVRNHLPN